MNELIIFFVGAVTFVLMLLVKIPIKKWTCKIAKNYSNYKHLNILLIIMNFVIAIICYSLVLQWMNIQHYKLCVAIKGGALAMAFYAIYEQWFGEDSLKEE